MTEENHDAIIRHECAIGELREQGEVILKRLDEQDANDVAIRDELIKKIEDNKSKFGDAMWAIAMLLLGGFVSGFIFAILYMIK
jgi:hypothetical protein